MKKEKNPKLVHYKVKPKTNTFYFLMNLLEIKAIQNDNIKTLLNVKGFLQDNQHFLSDRISIDGGKEYIKMDGLQVVTHDAVCDFIGIEKHPILVHVVGFEYVNNSLTINVREDWKWLNNCINPDLEIIKQN